jgi:HEAT repeat protein
LVIKASTAREVDTLIADLRAAAPVTRETAIARLTVIGARAIARLQGLAEQAAESSTTRTAALHALEQIGDVRALAPMLTLADDTDTEVAAAAVTAAGSFLQGTEGPRVLDRLTALALDRQRPARVRVAAIVAVESLKSKAVSKALAGLARDPDPAVAAAVASGKPGGRQRPDATLEAAAAGQLPDDPAVVRRSLARDGASVPVTILGQLVEQVRTREQHAPATQRAEWMTNRAAIHALLAQRGSRLGLYDVRETIAGAKGPVALDILTAVSEIGDASCLDAIAAAYTAASEKERPDEWWRRHLTDAFRAIVRREQLTKRHAAVKRVWTRWERAASELWPR